MGKSQIYFLLLLSGLPQWLRSKESARNTGATKDAGSIPGSGRSPWRRAWQPPPVPLPGESHGQRSLAGCSPWGRTESDMTERSCTYCFGTVGHRAATAAGKVSSGQIRVGGAGETRSFHREERQGPQPSLSSDHMVAPAAQKDKRTPSENPAWDPVPLNFASASNPHPDT